VALNFDFHPQTMLQWLREAQLAPRAMRALSYFRLPVLKRLIPHTLLVTLDALVQPSGQWVQLSPSLFVRAQATGASPVASPGHFFRCPECGSLELNENGDHLRCSGCDRRWAMRDGIYDFKEPLA
jgi:hypothetical protein